MTEIERDVMEYDVVIVGAGPAGLACAIRLKQLQARAQRLPAREGRQRSARMRCRAAVLEPEPLDAAAPGLAQTNTRASSVPAARDEFALLTEAEALQAADPAADEQSRQLHRVARQPDSVPGAARLRRWAATCSRASPLRRRSSTRPARSAACASATWALDKDGTPGPNFAPGPEIRAKTTILAEGCRGSVSKVLIERFRLDAGRSPQTYGLGFKELWQLPEGRVEPGLIQHTVGWPDRHADLRRQLPLPPRPEPHLRRFRRRPRLRGPALPPVRGVPAVQEPSRASGRCSRAANSLTYGARTIIEGGWQSLPKLEMPGALLVGDAGGHAQRAQDQGRAPGDTLRRARGRAPASRPVRATGFDQRWRASDGGTRTLQGAQHAPRLPRGPVARAGERARSRP